MSLRTAALAAAILLAFSGALAAELQPVQSVQALPPLQVVEYQGKGWVTTAQDGRLVNWNNEPGFRDEAWVTWSERPTGLESWNDSLVVHLEGVQSRLIYREETGFIWNLEKPAGWHLPNVILDDTPYRVLIDPTFYVLVYTAPGFGTLVGLLDLNQQIGPQTMGDHAGTLAAVGSAEGAYVVDLAEPMLPGIAAGIAAPEPELDLLDLAMTPGFVHLLWEGLLQTYDLTEPESPVLVDQAACDGTALVASRTWVVAYGPGTGAMESYALSPLGELTPAAVASSDHPVTVEPQIHGSNVVLQDATGVRAFRMSLAATMTELGVAWPLLPSQRLVAHGGWAWCLGDQRRVGYRHEGAPWLTDWPVAGDLVDAQVDGDLLVTATADGVRLDALPAVSTPPTGWQDVGADLQAVAVAGDVVAAATREALELLDVSDPAQPALLGALPLASPASTVALAPGVAVAAIRPDAGSDEMLVVDVSNPMAPVLTAQVALDFDGSGWLAVSAVHHAGVVRMLCRRGDEIRDVAVALDDPGAPTLIWSGPDPVFWCYDATGAPLDDPRPVSLASLHVAARGDTVTAYTGAADALTPMASWTAPGPVSGLAAVGNRLLVASPGRLDMLTYSDGSLVSAPAREPARPVRAVPNPFNPLTELSFSLPEAGRARLTIHDIQGRLVRVMEVDGPAGEQRIAWDGRTDDGRAVPSGQYLLRVVSDGVIRTGRCTLIR